MPTREEILAGLTSLANEYSDIAIAWHIIILMLIAALFAGWKPRNRLMILLLSTLFLSVSVFAGIENNVFNAAIFAFLVIMSIYTTLGTGNGLIRGDRSWPDITGLSLIIFGLIYPEFFQTDSFLEFAYAAPTGLVPCPTLCVLTGFALLYRGFGSVTWSLTVVAAGIFYGFFGVFYLGVNLDWFLVAGSLILLLNTFILSRTASLKR
ncbi:MAG TPA: hypothetical protein VFP97_03305 [Chitinophagaceae bacterium]|nr:hypothetical protein [Chitinophagaceae bacterium]